MASDLTECAPRHDGLTCVRCGHRCPHVEASGLYHCPNCGVPARASGRGVTYAFGHGCASCGLPGRGPLPRGDAGAVPTGACS